MSLEEFQDSSTSGFGGEGPSGEGGENQDLFSITAAQLLGSASPFPGAEIQFYGQARPKAYRCQQRYFQKPCQGLGEPATARLIGSVLLLLKGRGHI